MAKEKIQGEAGQPKAGETRTNCYKIQPQTNENNRKEGGRGRKKRDAAEVQRTFFANGGRRSNRCNKNGWYHEQINTTSQGKSVQCICGARKATKHAVQEAGRCEISRVTSGGTYRLHRLHLGRFHHEPQRGGA